MNGGLDQLAQLLNGAIGVWIVLFAIVGLALNYAGFKIYWLLMFLIGMIPGVVIGFGVATASGWQQVPAAVAGLVCGMITGMLGVWLTLLAIFLLGALVGAAIAAAFGAHEPVILIISGFIGGGAFVGLHGIAIVIGTAFSGSAMLTYAALNAISLARHGHPAWLPGDFITYGGRLLSAAARGGSAGAVHLLRGDLLVFLFFFATGLLVQFNFHRIFGRAAKAGSGAAVKVGGKLLTPAKAPEAPKQIPEKTVSPGWKLSLYEAGVHLGSHRLGPGNYLLGREEGVDFLLNDEGVSRRHLEIICSEDGKLALRDVGSSNGTWKRGTDNVKEDVPANGDWYQLGQAQLLFEQQPAG